MDALKESNPTGPDAADVKRVREGLEPTLTLATLEFEGLLGVRNFHILCDLLTIATVWAMEWRRKDDE